MPSIAARQATHAWILFVLLIVLSTIAGYAGAGGLVGSGVVLVAAFAKGQWMLMDSLKLRHVPPGWRILLSSWLVLVAASAWTAAVPLSRG